RSGPGRAVEHRRLRAPPRRRRPRADPPPGRRTPRDPSRGHRVSPPPANLPGVRPRYPRPAAVPRDGFGPRLQSLLGALSGVYRLSRRLARRLAGDLLGLTISTGAVAELQRRTAEALARPMEEIIAAVRSAPAVHVDETGWRQERALRGTG